MFRLLRLILVLTLTLILSACASGPRFEGASMDSEVTPAMVASEPEPWISSQVIWAGVIISTENLSDYTELEVLSYPLRQNQRPDLRKAAQGRFIVRVPGYLESADFAPGREVTVFGELLELLPGRVGQASYQFPVVATQAPYLWPVEAQMPATRPRISIGVGVIFRN